MSSMKGKVVLITGGASGYGNAMVKRFNEEGAQVIAADINAAMLEEAKGENPSIDTYILDVTNARKLERNFCVYFSQIWKDRYSYQ